MDLQLTRRQALAMSMAAALPLGGISSRAGAAKTQNPTIGLSTLGFPQYTNAELAKELAANGIRTIQLFLTQKDSNYWKYNSRNDISDIDPARAKAIASAYRSQKIAIHSIGVYTNLIHPDKNERNANLEYFEEMMRIGEAMDVHTFITEAGHYDPEPPETGVPYYLRQEVWNQMVNTGKTLAAMAEKHNATVLFEPFYRGFLASAKRTRLFLEAIASKRTRALLDPANLIEFNDIEEMFAQLGPFIDCLHAKDRKLHVDQGVPAGQGDVDYAAFVKQAEKHAPHAPFILEYVGPADYKQALALLQDAIRRAGATDSSKPESAMPE